ncbi:MAG: Kef-type K+ transport system membrane component KefB [Verrucomicrobiales bacterium]|jgi:Kef-type K+ transport system membrane component KefB
MDLLYILLVLLLVTRVCGEFAVRLKQPALVGELISGILVGVVVNRFHNTFPILSEVTENPVFTSITDLGVFFLMLLAGLEMHPKELIKSSGSAFAVALAGLIVPLGAGITLGMYALPESEWKTAQVMFLATAMAITAIPVAVKVLMDIGQLQSKAGKIIVSAAVYDDIFGLVLLAILTALLQTGEVPSLVGFATLIGKVVLFFIAATFLGWYALPRLSKWLKKLWVDEIEFSVLLIMGLAFAMLAEAFHLHFILGAFLAGLFFTGRTFGTKIFDDVESKVTAISSGFLAPVFFASIGLHLDLSAVTAIPWFVLALVALAILSKLIGAGVAARLVGLKRDDAIGVGISMSARGAVELIIADIALRAGLFSKPTPVPPLVANLFSAVVIMAVVTTLIMPIGVRVFLGNGKQCK